MKIEVAAEGDGAEILAVYSQYIDTPVTFECGLPSPEEFSGRIGGILKDYPYLVCREAGRLLGYACAHRFREREAYRWGAELSIYLDSGATSRGIGKLLYSILIDLLERQGVRTVYGCVTMPNPGSEKLHERLGFRRIGTFRRAGFKNGAWHDVTWFEKEIAAYDVPPSEFVPFSRLRPETVGAVIGRRPAPEAAKA